MGDIGKAKRPSDFIFKLLGSSTAAGAPTGDVTNLASTTVTATSTAAVPFEYSSTSDWVFSRMCILMVDGGSDPADFGAIVGGLSTATSGSSTDPGGLRFRVLDSSSAVLIDFTADRRIKTNSDFVLLAGVDANIETGVGDDSLQVRWTLTKAGEELMLHAGERVQAYNVDNLDPVTSLEVMVQGVRI
jgi:hypothetical protein